MKLLVSIGICAARVGACALTKPAPWGPKENPEIYFRSDPVTGIGTLGNQRLFGCRAAPLRARRGQVRLRLPGAGIFSLPLGATLAAFLALTTSGHAAPRDEDQFHEAWRAKTEQLEKDVKASNPDVVEIRLAGNRLILGTKEPQPTENDWQAMATARDKADAWPQYAETACHSTQLHSYMSKGFSVVFRLYDTTGNLRVTYAPVDIGACGK